MDPKSRGLKMLEIIEQKINKNVHLKVVTAVENKSALLCSPTGKLSEVRNLVKPSCKINLLINF